MDKREQIDDASSEIKYENIVSPSADDDRKLHKYET